MDFDHELKLVIFPFPEIEVLKMLGIDAVYQRVLSPAASKSGSRRVFALRQVVVEEGKMRRRDDFYHFGFGIERRKSAVFFCGCRRNQLPSPDERDGFLFAGIFAAGGKKADCKEKCEREFHAFVVLGKGRLFAVVMRPATSVRNVSKDVF